MLPDGTFQTRIELPESQQHGINWYHTHQHGSTADQVYGGLAGLIQVGDPLDPFPQYRGRFNERLFALTLGNVSVDPATGDRTPDDVNYITNQKPPYLDDWEKRVNGQLNPTFTLRPGESEVWTFASIGRTGFYNLGVVDENGETPWQGTIIAHDGNSIDLVPRALSLGLPEPYLVEGPTFVAPGQRLTMAVTAPTEPGTYYIVDNMAPNIQPLGDGEFFALATIVVEGDPVDEPPPVFDPVGSIPEVYSQEPDHRREFVFHSGGGKFTINGFAFPDSPIVTIQAGQIEEWTLVNSSNVDHPFHIHQNDFAVISINGEPIDTSTQGGGVYDYVSMRDTITIPANGEVVIRWEVQPHFGKYVFHCHILTHEDAGMMMGVLAVFNPEQRRIAVGAGVGQGGGVIVQDGDGNAVGRVDPLPRPWMGGVSTAVGDLNGDLVEDIIAAPARRGSRGFVTIYDGRTLEEIGRFRPFPEHPFAGVSLASGDLDHDGRPEIIAGRVAPGGSLVRIFDADGSLVRELAGALPGHFPEGVTVASTDYNGDNYDDLAIGAGRFREPIVVGLDGFSIGVAHHSAPQELFAFTAPGGRSSGVQVSGGYLDPTTRPGLLSNLITSPLIGRDAGVVSVWNVAPSLETVHGSPNAHAAVPINGHDGHDGSHDMEDAPPALLTQFSPFRRRSLLGLNLQFNRLGFDGSPVVVSWRDAHRPVYTTIGDDGEPTDLAPPPG
jgi:FtsP/CotA-like multicopper oxidase with cupredoxin domain